MEIKATRWSEEERAERDAELCETVGLLQDRAIEVYGEPSVRRLRDAFLKGRFVFRGDNVGRKAMETLLQLESDFLSAHIRQVEKVAHSFARTHKSSHIDLDFDDFRQEGCMALINAIYHYNGSTAFSTYCGQSVRRSLCCFVRDSEAQAGVGRGIKKMRKIVKRLMNQAHCDFKTAIEKMRTEMKMQISDTEETKLLDSLYRTVSLNNRKDNRTIDVPAPTVGGNINIDAEVIQQSIQQADLTDLEIRLIHGHMNGDQQTKLTEEINPNTGRPYTRQALSQTFRKACRKVEKVLREKEFAA